jgi:poly-gamma-glutamate synthesis protein (capsule biosynthesis protein)
MINIIIAGDFCPRYRIEKLINESKYDSIFGQIKPITAIADYSCVNLEAPAIINNAKPIDKTGPNLKCTKQSLYAIRDAGFDMVTLANNHIRDYGDDGVNNTLIFCEEAKLDRVGAGRNLEEAQRILYKEIKKKKFAFINFCENEWSIATNRSAGANPLDIVANYYQIQEAKHDADYVVVIVHGGHENYQLPSPRMKGTYRFFINSGANVVINHHQHCYSGYEKYNNGFIFYGLGNFCFDNMYYRNSIWNEGYMANLNFDNDRISVNLIPYKQCGEMPNVEILDKTESSVFEEKIQVLNNIILDDSKLQHHFEDFCRRKEKSINASIEFYSNRYLRKLYSMGLLPSFVTKNKRLLLKNMIRCESHRDILLHTL